MRCYRYTESGGVRGGARAPLPPVTQFEREKNDGSTWSVRISNVFSVQSVSQWVPKDFVMLLWLQYLKQLELAVARAAETSPPGGAPVVKTMCKSTENFFKIVSESCYKYH